MNKTLLRFLVILVMLSSSITSFGQTLIRGKVTSSEDNSPIPGASVVVNGSKGGTTTNVNGEYEIKVPQNSSLKFSFLGFETRIVKVGNASTLNVVLSSSSTDLEEVTITGAFGVEKKQRTLGYAVQSVNGYDIAETQRENFLTALQGRVAGATINTTSGAPGASSQIVLRGFNSLSGNNSPLIVIDGLPVSNNTFDQNNLAVQSSNRNNDFSNRASDINPNDIASITILKGPEATALYGIEAGSGAIIITTKKGEAGKLKLSYDNNFRVENTFLLPEIQTVYGLGVNGDGTQRTRSAFGPKLVDGTPLYDNIGNFFENAFTQKHNLSIDGGKKRLFYRASLGTTNQDGTIPNTGLDRYNVRGSLTYKMKKLELTGSTAYTLSNNQKALRGSGGFLQGLLSWPIQDDASKYVKEDGSRRRFFDDANFAESDNPFWSVNKNQSSDNTNRWNHNFSANYKFNKTFSITARGSYDGYLTTGNTFFHPLSNDYFTVGGQIENYSNKYRGLSGVVLGTSEFKVGKMNHTVRLGTAVDDFKTDIFAERGQKLQKSGEDFINDLATADPTTLLNSRTLGRDTLILKRLQGVFGEYNFSYDKWMNITVTGRNDWTSTLPKESRSFFYPSASMAFNFTELFPVKSKILTFGKLRASMAQTAKDIQPYGNQSVYNRQLTSGLGYGYGFTNNNPFIQPERQRTYELGTELQFFKKRFGIDYTFYNTLNIGQIVRLVRLSYGSGFILSTLNVADTRNKGMELILTGQPIKKKDIVWNINLNMSGTVNKVLSLPANIPEYYNSDTFVDAFRNGIVPGGSTTSITGQDYLRNTKGQILIDPGTGNPLTNTVYQNIGERNPALNGGLINSLTYKNFTASIALDFRIGGDIINGTEYWMANRGYSTKTLNREQPILVNGVMRDGLEETANPTVNQIQLIPYFNSTYYSDGRMYPSNFVEKDINWTRLREVRLAYKLPSSITGKNSIFKGAQIFVSGTDLFILTNYSGADPSVNANSAATSGVGGFGIDYFSPSTPRGLNGGIRLNFNAK